MSGSAAGIKINSAALRHIRRLTGLGTRMLADEVGVTPSYISNLESGRRVIVSPRVFAALCQALRLDDRRALMADPADSQSRLSLVGQQ